MSVMLTDDFVSIAKVLWGDDWKSYAAKRLDRSERALFNIETGTTKRVVPCLREELLRVVREQIRVLKAFDDQFS